jgi:CheY-like chemotaxis protein
VRYSAYSLLDIINDILDFSKIEAGKLEIIYNNFDLYELVNKSIRILSTKCLQKNLELMFDFDPDVPLAIMGDSLRIRQILINLLSNAEKFTNKGEIFVKVKRGPSPSHELEPGNFILHIEVTDTGIGIPYEKQALIFESFTQAEGTTSKRYGGTGLGLTISKTLANLMGGDLFLVSEPGQGSTFTLAIPVKESAIAVESRINIPENIKRVLVVDDNHTNLRILNDILERKGIQTITCDSAAGAYSIIAEAVAKNDKFDILILDMQMPDEDGLSLAHRLKTEYRLPTETCILMYSSIDKDLILEKAKQININLFLTKPVNMYELYETLNLSIGNQETKAERRAEAITTHKDKSPAASVLVAEDNEINMKIVTSILARMGIKTHCAKNGLLALELLQVEKIDLILMDIHMPEMDGLEATEKIRKSEHPTKHVPIVALTADAMKGDREKCLAAGMDDYITKPFKPDDIRRVLEVYLGKQFS